MDASRNEFIKSILNAGLRKAGDALTRLVGTAVNLKLPQVNICHGDELQEQLGVKENEKVITITQSFDGPLSGKGVLVLSGFSGILLTQRLMEGRIELSDLQKDKMEALSEVGNIIINSFVGSWSEIVDGRFEFGIPDYAEYVYKDFAQLYHIDNTVTGNESYAVWGNAHFDISDFFIMGTIMAFFEKGSFEKTTAAVPQT